MVKYLSSNDFVKCSECGYKFCKYCSLASPYCCWCFAKIEGYIIGQPCCFGNYGSDRPELPESEQFGIAHFITKPRTRPVREPIIDTYHKSQNLMNFI